MKQTFTLFFLLLFLCGSVVFGQDRTIKGKVTDGDSGEPLIGAQIIVEGTTTGTVTDFDGKYELSVPNDANLLFKYVGYEDKVMAISGDVMNVKMGSSSIILNEAVVSASRRKEKILDAPASISTIDSKAIANKVPVTATDILKDVNGVDIVQSGLTSSNVVVRGFNNIFSGSLLSLVDNRIAAVPSLAVNAYQMIPNSNDDIEKIEVLRGPASALYGPNSADGVMHMITKSPIEHPGTKVSLGVGFRSKIEGENGEIPFIGTGNPDYRPRFDNESMGDRMILTGDLRHAGKFDVGDNGMKIGYKISGTYMQGDDWKYNDISEPDSIIRSVQGTAGEQPLLANGEIDPEGVGELVSNGRDEDVSKYGLDGRVDFRFNSDTELILSAGFNSARNVEMTGIGSAQTDNWRYTYTQARLRHKNLFIQGFVNSSDAGDETFLLRSGNAIYDKSKLWVGQIQHSYSPMKKMNFVYGFDALLTRPDTKNTINGRFEDDDDINQLGVYLQGDYDVSPKLTLLAALRADTHNYVDGVFLSPRGAIVYKPTTKQTFRLTYNRAFGSPSSNNLFLDLLQFSFPGDVLNIRVSGNQAGFNYNYADNPYFDNQRLPQFRASTNPNPAIPVPDANTYYHVGDAAGGSVGWQAVIEVLRGQFLALSPDNATTINSIVDSVIPKELNNVDQVVKDLNLTALAYEDSDWKNISDVGSMRHTVTTAYELGYKGIIGDKLFVTLDGYRSDIKDFVSPVTLISPSVLLDPVSLEAELFDVIGVTGGGGTYDQFIAAAGPVVGPVIHQTLVDLLEGTEAEPAEYLVERNGDPIDELVNIAYGAVQQLPIGSITPVQANGSDMLVTYRNIGDVTVYGLDLGLNYYLSDEVKIRANASWIDKDSIAVEGAQFGYIALNAPKFKVGLGVDYTFSKIGLNVGARWRWQDDYPANSGAYVGRVEEIHDMDVNLAWVPGFSQNTMVSLAVTNIYNNERQQFVGAPMIGRMALLRLSQKF